MGTAHIVCDIFGEANGFDGRASKVTGADEAAAEVEEDLWGPGSLGIAGVPEGGEKPL